MGLTMAFLLHPNDYAQIQQKPANILLALFESHLPIPKNMLRVLTRAFMALYAFRRTAHLLSATGRRSVWKPVQRFPATNKTGTPLGVPLKCHL